MSGFDFRRVRDDDVESAFLVLQRVAVWLQGKGRRQRIANTTMDTYRSWQETGSNYVVVDGDRSVGVFSVSQEISTDWPEQMGDRRANWLRALATDPDHRGRNIGAFAIKSALSLDVGNPLYLDCVSDFLPGYYESHGFRTIATQSRTFGDETLPMDITLLVHRNNH